MRLSWGKKMGWMLSLFVILHLIWPVNAFAALYQDKEVLLKLNNGYILYSVGTMPYIDKNGRTLIPLRMIGDLMGSEVSWDEKKKLATVTHDKTTIVFPIGQKYYQKNGIKLEMDTSAVISGDSMMIPVRYVAEAELNWDADNWIVELKHTDLLKTNAFTHFDEMENLDKDFEGKLVPVNVEYVKGKTVDDNKLLVSILNDSTTTIQAQHLHRNAIFYSDPDTEMGQGSFGHTASSGMTGYNVKDIAGGSVFVDMLTMKSLETAFNKPIKYLIFNYFNTIQSK
ncbi:copper amine oxidase N-terminal domain-containing protein [Cohnella yongneupensis]|uniref:Copper amine oxidase N-terminal domain-containing protein n=1 Tax=Cohnella yongneupensis TaxID=425006 RepID=A0ABW0R6Q7_9BACL